MNHTTVIAVAFLILALPSAASEQQQRPPRLTNVTEERYRLQPGDVLEVQFRYSSEFNQTVTVQPDGYVSLEIGGDIKVAGMTVEQTRLAILTKGSARLQDPVITGILKEFQTTYFGVV